MLTPKELEVLQLVSKGLPTKKISEKLHVTDHTVDGHRKNLLRKFHAKNSVDLVRRAFKANWLTMLLLTLSCQISRAQLFTIKRIELLDQKVVLHYDLTDSVRGRSFTIAAYRSNDNFLNPLQHATGDIGLEVQPGNNKKIMWDAKTELGENFSGGISLEIRGKVYIPFVRFAGFDEYKSIKRLRPYDITWNGGTSQNVLNFDLLKGERKIMTFPNIANVGHYKLTLPRNIKPGKDYRFRVSDTKNKDEVVYTGKFIVKRKIPLLVKIVPVLALGYGATFLGGGDPWFIPDPVDPK
jgi:DNA-binding CsgD family transcriptional regulator